MDRNARLQICADNIRWLSAAMPQEARSGHPGGPLGGADFASLLFAEYLVHDPDDPMWRERDRFFLDAGHMSAMLYAVLALVGRFTMDDLRAFRRWGSPTPGHPEHDVARGIENTSGPLGLGHAFGAGAALAERFLAARFGEWTAHRTWIYLSDGGVQEEISQGVGRIAGHLGLSNIVMFFDSNRVQLSTRTEATSSEDTAAKYRAWGWNVHEVDGHDFDALRGALDAALIETRRPTLVIGRTVIGRGARHADGTPWEDDVEQHGAPFGPEATRLTIRALGGDPVEPFQLHPVAVEVFAERARALREIVARRRAAEAAWRKQQPDAARRYDDFFRPGAFAVDWDNIDPGSGVASRVASARVLTALADQVPNMVVASADLANSDRTDAFLKRTRAFAPGDFGGAFLHAGVAELTMSALCTGMALHGGVLPACATFFVFSDYQKPVLRLAALQELQVVFVWTHDSFRVGEDGPTHQPIEQEAQLRLLEQIRNFSGRPSFTALRPGDAAETVEAWKFALSNHHGPTGLILTRQDLPDLPGGTDRRKQASGLVYGGYVVTGGEDGPDVVLLANGSELGLAEAAAGLLRCDGLRVQVSSIPSLGLFLDQNNAWREKVVPRCVPCYALTAGLPSVWSTVLGPLGESFGLERFGASANFKVLDEKFGFLPDLVAARVRDFLLRIPSRVRD